MIQELAEKVLETIYDIIVIVDAKLNVLDANNAVTSLGYSKEDLIGKPVLDLVIDNRGFREVFPELIKKSATGERKVVRFEAIRKDSSRLWVDITASAIDATPVEDYLITIRDVDDRQRTRRELEEQKAKLESVFAETDKLRKEAEASKLQLQIANEQLQKRQAVTEKALEEEQTFRLKSQQTSYQKTIITYLILLIGFVLFIPYLSGFMTVQEKVIDGSINSIPLIIQILSASVGLAFGVQMEKSNQQNRDNSGSNNKEQ